MIAAVRDLLDRIPTPIKVALWLAVSAAVAKIGEALTAGTIVLDPTTLATVNIVLVLVRSRLDRMAPALTGATYQPPRG